MGIRNNTGAASPGLYRWSGRIAAWALTLALAACGGGGSSSNPPGAGAGGQQTAALTGRVVDAQTGEPVPNATVKAGTQSAVSDASGSYTLSGLALSERVVINANANTHAETTRIASAPSAGTQSFDVRMLKIGASVVVASASGGTVNVPNSTAQVVLPPDFAATLSGGSVSGTVTVRVTPIAPANSASLMPGDYTTVSGTGTLAIESFGAMTVNLLDASGQPLQLASGKTATIRIPVSTRTPGPLAATIPLFRLNPETGRWEQQGTATLGGVSPNEYYEGVVSRFSTWNADQIMDSVTVTGCLRDADNQPVAGALISTDGIDYSGVSTSRTDASGAFTISIKRGGRAAVGAFSNGRFSNEVAAGPSTNNFSLGICLTLSATATGDSVKIKLTWGQNPTDVDSYLTLPTGEVIYFSNRGNQAVAPFVDLNIDDTDSFGPEIVTISRLMVGTYRYAVNNYSATHTPGLTGSPVSVELSIGSNAQLYSPPAGEADSGRTTWSVFNLTVAANCAITVTRVDTWSVGVPTGTASSSPTYCTR